MEDYKFLLIKWLELLCVTWVHISHIGNYLAFLVSVMSVFSISWSIMDLLNTKCKDIIKWLKKEDYEAIAKEFNHKQKRQFPNVIGAT